MFVNKESHRHDAPRTCFEILYARCEAGPSMRGWDGPFEKQCHCLVAAVCDAGRSGAERKGAWRELLGLVAPHVESWAATNPTLRRCGLGLEDEVRSVLVGVLSRMSARDHENLRSYLARRPAAPEDEVDAALVERVVRLVYGAPPWHWSPWVQAAIDLTKLGVGTPS